MRTRSFPALIFFAALMPFIAAGCEKEISLAEQKKAVGEILEANGLEDKYSVEDVAGIFNDNITTFILENDELSMLPGSSLGKLVHLENIHFMSR